MNRFFHHHLFPSLCRIGLICSAFLLFFATLSPAPVSALSAYPVKMDVSADAGGVAQATFEVRNDESVEKTFYLSIQKFVPRGTDGQQTFLPPTDVSGLPSWLYLDRASVDLAPGASQKISFSFRPPVDALPGGYYGAIFLSADPPVDSGSSDVVQHSRIGILVFATVNGAAQERLSLQNWSVSPKKTNRLPVVFSAIFRNEGSIHSQPRGVVRIRGWFQRIDLPFNAEGSRVLPGSDRALRATWSRTTEAVGESQEGFFAEVRKEWREFGFGPYRATLDANGIVSQEIVFWVWPWHILFAGFVILCAAALAISFGYRWWIRRPIS